MLILGGLCGRVCCRLGYHAWARPQDHADWAMATMLGYAARCQRCGAEQEVNRDL